MCRSIKVLRKPDEIATSDEVRAAARQFVRKISGFHKPSRANHEAFERAIEEIAASSSRLLAGIASQRPHEDVTASSAAAAGEGAL